MDEYDVRRWFMAADLKQAQDTFRVVEGILQTRESMQPKRKRRSDAGQLAHEDFLRLKRRMGE